MELGTNECAGAKFWTIIFYETNGKDIREAFKLGNDSFEGVQYSNHYKLKK